MKCPFCKDLTIAAVIQFFWRSDEAATLISLGEVVKKYLEHLVYTNQPIKKLLALNDEYGSYALSPKPSNGPLCITHAESTISKTSSTSI